jgi:hypothetical protein
MQFQVLNALAISTNKTGIKRVFLIRGNRTVLSGRSVCEPVPASGKQDRISDQAEIAEHPHAPADVPLPSPFADRHDWCGYRDELLILADD